MRILKEMYDQLSLLATLSITSEFNPQESAGGFHHVEQERYIHIIRELFPLRSINSKKFIKIAGENFELIDKGKNRNFRYLLIASDGTLIWLTGFAYKDQPFCKIVLCQPGVWIDPINNAQKRIKLLKELFGPIDYHVASLDMCVHFTGWDIRETLKLHFSGTVEARITCEDKYSNFSGFEAGTKEEKARSPFMKLYKKSLQLHQDPSAPRPHFLYDPPIDKFTEFWNLEFHFNSRTLKEFKITTLENIESKKQSLWKYSTVKFIKAKAMTRDMPSFKKNKKIINEWKVLQKCFSTTEDTIIDRIVRTSSTEAVTAKNLNKLKGLLLSYARASNIDGLELDEVLSKLRKSLSQSSRESLSWSEYVPAKTHKLPKNSKLRSIEI